MATSYGTAIPTIVVYRVSMSGNHAKVRIWIGQEGQAGLCGELTMTAADWQLFRALLPKYDPQKMAIHYSDDAWYALRPAGNGGD